MTDRWRRLRKITAYARAQGECTFHLDDDGIRSGSAFGEHKAPWTAFRHYVETPGLFLLVRDDGMGTMTVPPKRGVGGGPEVEGLRAIVTRHLAPRPRAVRGARPEGARRGRRG
ncbi:YcxB family protein [Streptomyces sp. NPDC001070]